jgi:hypothetical protein
MSPDSVIRRGQDIETEGRKLCEDAEAEDELVIYKPKSARSHQ